MLLPLFPNKNLDYKLYTYNLYLPTNLIALFLYNNPFINSIIKIIILKKKAFIGKVLPLSGIYIKGAIAIKKIPCSFIIMPLQAIAYA